MTSVGGNTRARRILVDYAPFEHILFQNFLGREIIPIIIEVQMVMVTRILLWMYPRPRSIATHRLGQFKDIN